MDAPTRSSGINVPKWKRDFTQMSLVQSAKLNGLEPWAYLKDVLERLLAHPNKRIDELLPHRWARAA